MNIDPVLMCARCQSPTLHIFVESRPARRRPGELAYVDFIYACDRCGSVRPWGNGPRKETVYRREIADATLAHAVDEHGMRLERCTACGGGSSLDCSECDDEGEVWVFDSLDPCGPACPIADVGLPGDE
jgi:hypothetical protein